MIHCLHLDDKTYTQSRMFYFVYRTATQVVHSFKPFITLGVPPYFKSIYHQLTDLMHQYLLTMGEAFRKYPETVGTVHENASRQPSNLP